MWRAASFASTLRTDPSSVVPCQLFLSNAVRSDSSKTPRTSGTDGEGVRRRMPDQPTVRRLDLHEAEHPQVQRPRGAAEHQQRGGLPAGEGAAEALERVFRCRLPGLVGPFDDGIEVAHDGTAFLDRLDLGDEEPLLPADLLGLLRGVRVHAKASILIPVFPANDVQHDKLLKSLPGRFPSRLDALQLGPIHPISPATWQSAERGSGKTRPIPRK